MNDTHRLPIWKYMTARKIQKASKGLCSVDVLKHDTFGSRKPEYGRLAFRRWTRIAAAEMIHVVVDAGIVKVRRALADKFRNCCVSSLHTG